MPRPIIKNRVRILRPSEYDLLRIGAETLDNRTRLDACLLSGTRFVEAQRLQRNPDWFDGETRFIHLAEFKAKRRERGQRERWVRLSDRGVTVLPYFFKSKPLPTDWGSWTENLHRWASRAGLDPVAMGPKSTRKSWESWLVYVFPERVLEVLLSQGHTETTAIRHYLGLPFSEDDKHAMKEWVAGWVQGR